MSVSIDHIGINVTDLDKARAFYASALAPLGMKILADYGDVFGMGTGTVDADVHYAVTRTMWVEPQTGAVIKGQSDQKRRFVVGALERPYLVGLIGYTPETVAANVQAQRSNAQKLHLLNDLALPVGVIAGLLLTLLGLMLVLRRTPDAAAAPSAPPARHLDAWASDV